jgi:hypothetical protein
MQIASGKTAVCSNKESRCLRGRVHGPRGIGALIGYPTRRSSGTVSDAVDMSIVAVDPPPSLPWHLLFFLAWPLLAVRFARRGVDTRLLMALPVALGTVMLAIGIGRVANVASLTGPAPHAVAAGLAESIIPVVIGALSSLLVVVITAFKRTLLITSDHPSVTLGLLAVVLATETTIGASIRANSVFSRITFGLVLAGLILAITTCLLIAWLIGTTPLEASRPIPPKSWCTGFALAVLALALGASVVIRNLAQFARGPGA